MNVKGELVNFNDDTKKQLIADIQKERQKQNLSRKADKLNIERIHSEVLEILKIGKTETETGKTETGKTETGKTEKMKKKFSYTYQNAPTLFNGAIDAIKGNTIDDFLANFTFFISQLKNVAGNSLTMDECSDNIDTYLIQRYINLER